MQKLITINLLFLIIGCSSIGKGPNYHQNQAAYHDTSMDCPHGAINERPFGSDERNFPEVDRFSSSKQRRCR